MCFTPLPFPTSLIGGGNESWLPSTLLSIYTLFKPWKYKEKIFVDSIPVESNDHI